MAFCKITPLELASYDPSLSAGMNPTFVGTQLTEGRPDNGTACVVGLDQAGFVMGTSAGLFNVGCPCSRIVSFRSADWFATVISKSLILLETPLRISRRMTVRG